MANLVPLQAAIKLLADAADDVIAAKTSGAAVSVSSFANLVPDVLALLPQIGSISLSGLAPADYATLLTNLCADLALPAGHTASIINASVKILEDLVTVVYPDVQALVAIIQAAPASVAPAAPTPA